MGASSRYRIYEYLRFYTLSGLYFSVYPLFGDWYLKNLFQHRLKLRILSKLIVAYLNRLYRVLTMDKNSVAYIGAELFPYLPYGLDIILNIRKIPYIIEFDDAVFHNYDNNSLLKDKTRKVIKRASHVITGSRYLTDYVRQYNQKVTQIPTCIDAEKYKDAVPKMSEKFIIGWIGSHATSMALVSIAGALRNLSSIIDFELHLIGFDPLLVKHLDGIKYRIIEWSQKTEIENMRKFSVGIMPLKDTPFSRGKCAFKLVQYMAVGLPTISSPLQSNIDIEGGLGNLFATTQDEWVEAILKVYSVREKYNLIGAKNKEFAMQNYTFQVNYRKYIDIISTL